MPVIKQPLDLPARRSTIYPVPFAEGYEKRHKRALTDALGLTQFGVNLTILEPGARSAERHWHSKEDEALYVLSGTLTLITDAGETELTAGMAAGFPAGVPDGHHLVNSSSEPATYLEIGTRAPDEFVTYPDIDLLFERKGGASRLTHKNGEPYP